MTERWVSQQVSRDTVAASPNKPAVSKRPVGRRQVRVGLLHLIYYGRARPNPCPVCLAVDARQRARDTGRMRVPQ